MLAFLIDSQLIIYSYPLKCDILDCSIIKHNKFYTIICIIKGICKKFSFCLYKIIKFSFIILFSFFIWKSVVPGCLFFQPAGTRQKNYLLHKNLSPRCGVFSCACFNLYEFAFLLNLNKYGLYYRMLASEIILSSLFLLKTDQVFVYVFASVYLEHLKVQQ